MTPDRTARAGLRSVARGGALNLVGAVTAAGANFAISVVAARGFTQHTAGSFFAVTSLFLVILSICELGVTTGLVYFIARFRALGRGADLPAVLRAAFTPVTVLSVLLGLVLFVFAPRLAGPLISGPVSEHTVDYLRILAVLLPAAVIFDGLLAAARGFHTMRPTVVLDKLARPVGQLVFMIMVALGGGTTLLALAWAGPWLPTAVLAALWLRRVYTRRAGEQPPAPTEPAPADPAGPGVIRAFWRFTAPRSLAALVQMGLQRFDIVLVATLRGPVDAAVYTAATRFLIVGQLGGHAINQAVEPRLSELMATRDIDATNVVYRTATAWLMLISWPLYLMCAVFAPLLLTVFGGGYTTSHAMTVVVLLSVTMLVATGVGMVDTVLAMAGKTTWNLLNAILALAVFLGLDLLLIPGYGIIGAAVGWAAAICVKNLAPLLQLALTLRLHPFGRAGACVALLALTCFGVLPLAVRLIGGPGPIAAVLALLLGSVGYAVGAWRFRRILQLDALPLGPVRRLLNRAERTAR